MFAQAENDSDPDERRQELNPLELLSQHLMPKVYKASLVNKRCMLKTEK
jgi:hypothetical protein